MTRRCLRAELILTEHKLEILPKNSPKKRILAVVDKESKAIMRELKGALCPA